jgi:hypothetical protein
MRVSDDLKMIGITGDLQTDLDDARTALQAKTAASRLQRGHFGTFLCRRRYRSFGRHQLADQCECSAATSLRSACFAR